MKESAINKKYDGMGIFLSCACLLHCLALPILTYLAPSITVFFEQEWIHLLLVACLIPIALFTFIRSRKIHRNNNPLSLGLVAITFLILAIALEDVTKVKLEAIFTFIGSVTLIAAHLINISSMNKQDKYQ